MSVSDFPCLSLNLGGGHHLDFGVHARICRTRNTGVAVWLTKFTFTFFVSVFTFFVVCDVGFHKL